MKFWHTFDAGGLFGAAITIFYIYSIYIYIAFIYISTFQQAHRLKNKKKTIILANENNNLTLNRCRMRFNITLIRHLFGNNAK